MECHENPGKWHEIYLERSVSYTLLSSFAYMDVAPEGEHGCNFFHISEERGFGLIILIMGLDRWDETHWVSSTVAVYNCAFFLLLIKPILPKISLSRLF